MIITRTPYRISFFGGGTDYPEYFEKHGGSVLSTTIDKYVYITARFLPPFFEHKNHIVWSQIENTLKAEDIKHPAVRECLKYLNMNGVVVTHDGDLPARSGMGSSSAFTVGLLNALHALKHEESSPIHTALEAVYVEQQLIKEKVGNQDQLACSIGGLNVYDFYETQKTDPNVVKYGRVGFSYQRVDITPEKKRNLENRLLLVFTGFSHTASEIASTYDFNITELKRIQGYVTEAEHILEKGKLSDFGRLLDENWQAKKALSKSVSSPFVDWLYKTSLSNGALGGKLLGAGGGGFLLLYCEPEEQENLRKALDGLLIVPFRFESQGSQIIFRNGK
jgi:D-glycero-alpha-D-manno-heptose-7-phosphate kinase